MLAHALRRVGVGAVALAGAVERHAVGDELREVLVGREDERAPAGGVGAGGEGADEIVGLEAGDAQERDAHGLRELLGHGDGGGDVLGHLLALGFVGGVALVAEGGRGVHGEGDMGDALPRDHLGDGCGEEEDGGGVDAAGGHARA